MRLSLPVVNPLSPEEDLLPIDTHLRESDLTTLGEAGVEECWVQDPRLNELAPTLLDQFPAHRKTLAFLQTTFLACREQGTLQVQRLACMDLVKLLLSSLRRCHSHNLILQGLTTGFPDLVQHSLNVCITSLALGLRLEHYIAKERPTLTHSHAIDLVNLGVGALLHDIGFILLPEHYSQNGAGPFSPEECDVIRQHPAIGFQGLRNSLEAGAANILLNHHQRFDGKGYPVGCETNRNTGEQLADAEIPVFSRIVSLADTLYSSLQRVPYAERLEVQALYEMRFSLYRGWFDPEIERVFYHMCPPFPLGSRVSLSSGEEAVVERFNPTAPCQPSVKLLSQADGTPIAADRSEEIDLSTCSNTHIRFYKGKNVSAYLF
jgi:hypothetical protein